MNAPLVIAVDGPAASGKGTIARALGVHYGLPHLDTGLLYRAVGLRIDLEGRNLVPRTQAIEAARTLDPAHLSHPEIRSEAAAMRASAVAAIPEVRAALLAWQRDFVSRPQGAVLDGRDIGSVVLPSADAKLFVTATLNIRAKRRHDENVKRGGVESFNAFMATYADLARRDARDAKRAAAPMLQAADADLLDTSELAIDAAVRQAIALVEARIGRAR